VAEASIKIIFCYLLILADAVPNVNSQIIFERCQDPNFHKCRWVGDRPGLAGWIGERAAGAIKR